MSFHMAALWSGVGAVQRWHRVQTAYTDCCCCEFWRRGRSSGPIWCCVRAANGCSQEACRLDAAGTLLASAQGQPLSLGQVVLGHTNYHSTRVLTVSGRKS